MEFSQPLDTLDSIQKIFSGHYESQLPYITSKSSLESRGSPFTAYIEVITQVPPGQGIFSAPGYPESYTENI